MYVRLKLKDGERVGGVFSTQSFASTYPEPEDLYLEEAWRLNSDGSLVERIPGTAGLLVSARSIDLVELLEEPEES